MRTTKNLARRSSALVLAGALAFAGAACESEEPETDVEVTEDTDSGSTTEDTDSGSTTEDSTDDMSTETEGSTEESTE